MPYQPDKHHRRSIRLQGYDYSTPGAYFVTICTQHRECLFGNISGGIMNPNPAGQMIQHWWLELNQKFPSIKTDEFIVMPNHFHGIIVITGTPPHTYPPSTHPTSVEVDLCVYPEGVYPEGVHPEDTDTGAPLPEIVQWFKTMTTNDYIQGVKHKGWQSFNKKLWQRNYYERIIRNGGSLQRVRDYIIKNPHLWKQDQLHPENPSK
ncbi:MAG: hypothetical protein HC769_22930 [Cyanobacteria bacterium CRU_2_1]|nr:hypothetical protein [Cyanobacteria bacterium RU_5_0]NJR61432.1 hypothetical protein [Cyanobacteria bacterium CRU_2_1]